MTVSRCSRIVAAMILLAVGFEAPAHCQKIISEGIKDLATQIAANAAKEKKQRIAVLPFRELDGRPTVLSSYISEELVTNLFLIGGIDIVERSMLDRLLGELKLGQTGLIDPETAKRVGKVAGVDAIVTGSITDLQSYVALNCRLIDAQTGGIFAAAQAKIVKDDDVRKIMGTAVPSPVGEVQPSMTPEKAPPSTTVQKRQSGSFMFELRGCAISETSVECEFVITNSGKDDIFRFMASHSRLFDAEGNEYRGRVGSIGGRGEGEVPSTTMATGVPVKARLTFEGIPPELDRATLLEFAAYDNVKAQFRDVPLVR